MAPAGSGARWSFGPLARLHDRAVRRPRTTRLATVLAELAGGSAASLLDVGAGDGDVGRAVADLLGATEREAVDQAPAPASPCKVGDGARLPYADASFEIVLLADVLHHARDPGAVLGEALRCASRAVVVKDHLARGCLDRARLYAMDVVGNPARSVEIPGGYFSAEQLGALVRASGARIGRVAWPLDVHARWLRPFAPSEVQIAVSIVPCRTGRAP